MAMVYTLGHVSGGIFNPALIVGLYITGHISNLALLTYVAGHLAGSMLAAFIFKVMDDYMENKNLRI
jgi:aquaporin Z